MIKMCGENIRLSILVLVGLSPFGTKTALSCYFLSVQMVNK